MPPTSNEITTAMVHLYRAEVQRANVWRQRLDAATNWAVITAGAAISIAFSGADAHHGILILNNLLITAFLFMEAYRFRYYQLWNSRTRWMETHYFAGLLAPAGAHRVDWKPALAQQLLDQAFTISFREAILRRLGRSYLWVYLLLFQAWVLKLAIFPAPAQNLAEVVQRATILNTPGTVIAAIYLLVILALVVIFLFTLKTYGMFHETLEQVITPGKPGPKTPAR